MAFIDWFILIGTTLGITWYGLWKSRKSEGMEGYLRADHSLPWYTISLSIISTQASAVTFLSTPGQAYTDGMRFVMFYLGLPVAMIVLSVTVLPIYYKLNVYTAYEYLETRFDVKTRVITAVFFLIQRSLSAAISIAAPAIVLSVVLDWNVFLTNLLLGTLVIVYTVTGGAKAVSQTQKLQMIVILIGMFIAGYLVVAGFPKDISFQNALQVAGKTGKLNTMDFSFDWNNRYNFWSGLIGGFFLQMAYFGTDQSQVGRYLGGKSLTQSRLGLLFNGIFKIPMQFAILFIGVMLFVFYQFEEAPLFFNKVEVAKIQASKYADDYKKLETIHHENYVVKRQNVRELLSALDEEDETAIEKAANQVKENEAKTKALRGEAIELLKKNDAEANLNDTNYIFLTFVMTYLPAGLIGLLIAVILFAAMSTVASELSALGTTTVVDVYKRLFHNVDTDKHFVLISKIVTVFWGLIALVFANLATQLGTLIEVVNFLGSIFYGTILGIFVLALFIKFVKSNAVFIAAIISEIFVVFMAYIDVIAYLWLNMVGCLLVIFLAIMITFIEYIVVKPKIGNT